MEPPGVLSGKRPQDLEYIPMQTRLVPTRGLRRASFWPILEGEAGTESPQPPTAFLTAAGLQTIPVATQGLLIAQLQTGMRSSQERQLCCCVPAITQR